MLVQNKQVALSLRRGMNIGLADVMAKQCRIRGDPDSVCTLLVSTC